MDQFTYIILIVHIIAGSLSLISGPIAMMNQTGNNLHRTSGKIFFAGMTTVFVTAIYLSIVHELLFLFLIAVFSYYSIFIGYRTLYLKKLGKGQKPQLIDWSVTLLTTAFHLGLLVWGFIITVIQKESFGITALVFGTLGLAGNYRDIRHYIKGYKEKNGWLFVHITGMIGGYIAASTAFLVNTVHFQPSFILWLAPTIVFVPFMIYTTKKFRSKLSKGKNLNEVASVKL